MFLSEIVRRATSVSANFGSPHSPQLLRVRAFHEFELGKCDGRKLPRHPADGVSVGSQRRRPLEPSPNAHLSLAFSHQGPLELNIQFYL